MTNIALTVNGTPHEADVEPRQLLVYFLRETLGLKGTNVGCDTSSCGACTVLVDGESVKSCTLLAAQADGSEVTTIEGLASADEELHPVQQAFHDSTRCSAATARRASSWPPCRFLQENPTPRSERSGRRWKGTSPLHGLPQHRPRGRGGGEGGRMIPAAFKYERAGSVDGRSSSLAVTRMRSCSPEGNP